MWSFLKKIKDFFAKLFSKDGPADKAITKVLQLIPAALPIVEKVAILTPTRVDDEIISLFKAYGLPALEKWLSIPVENRGMALFYAASEILAKKFPGVPMNIINSAVQVAYTAWLAEQKKDTP